LLSLILLVGFMLRIYHLGSTSLWFDEIDSAGRINYPITQMIKNLSDSPFPPLYYILMNFWIGIFGISEFSLRFPSLVFSVLSIILIFKLAKELFNQRVGLFAALLLSVSLYSIDYAREAKMYAMLWFFGLLSFYFFYKFTKDNKNRDLSLYIASTVISIYTLYAGFLFIIIPNVAFFLFFFNAKQLKKWLVAQMLIVLLYLPWVGFFIHAVVNRTEIEWIPKEADWYLQFFLILLTSIASAPFKVQQVNLHIKCIYVIYSYLFLCVYAFLFFSAFVRPNRKEEKSTISFMKKEYFLLAWAVIPIISLYLIHIFIFPILMVRYIGFINIPLIILFSRGLDRYSAKIKYPFLIFLLCLVSTCQLYPYYKSNLKSYITYPQDWRGLFRKINQEKGDNAFMTMSPDALTKTKHIYFSKAIKYYNNNQEIPPLTREEMDKSIHDNKYDSIFVIYYLAPEIDGEIQGYRLEKKVEEGTIGYFWFKKL